jgi:formate dehydrogenase maturation protein FdhE
MSDYFWWCPNCKEEVDGHNVTFQEHHEVCGSVVQICELQDKPLTQQLAEVKAERDALAEQIACAQPPLMADVLADNQRLREALEKLEWCILDGANEPTICPACGGMNPKIAIFHVVERDMYPYIYRHNDTCWLAAALRKGRE